jgi:dolichol-phosphate mannosyltransferase
MRTDPVLPAQHDDLATQVQPQHLDADPRPGLAANLNDNADNGGPRLTVIVPTRNEEHNVEALLGRLGPATAPLRAEIIVVDDSDDDTPDAVAYYAKACSVPVRVVHRPPGSRRGGLSSAVIAGARVAVGDWVLVMDADLQHPPETAAVLASTAIGGDCDIVVGTRYADGGSPGKGLDGGGRVFVSSWATRFVQSVFPRRLAMVSDPLSGLFAFRTAIVNLDHLKPAGFKILLEILVRNPDARVAEVPYCFAPRNAGESKASLRQGLTFLRHVARLRSAWPSRQLRQEPSSRAGRIRMRGDDSVTPPTSLAPRTIARPFE